MDIGTMYRVVAPHYVAGFVVREGKVVAAAPILKWMIGKSFAEVQQYLKRKRYQVQKV